MQLNIKELNQLQIAIRLDDYFYEKDTLAYFNNMPLLDLGKSQLIFINSYLEVLENKDGYSKLGFEELLSQLISDNNLYKEQLENGSKSSRVKKYFKTTEHLINLMKKYNSKY